MSRTTRFARRAAAALLLALAAAPASARADVFATSPSPPPAAPVSLVTDASNRVVAVHVGFSVRCADGDTIERRAGRVLAPAEIRPQDLDVTWEIPSTADEDAATVRLQGRFDRRTRTWSGTLTANVTRILVATPESCTAPPAPWRARLGVEPSPDLAGPPALPGRWAVKFDSDPGDWVAKGASLRAVGPGPLRVNGPRKWLRIGAPSEDPIGWSLSLEVPAGGALRVGVPQAWDPENPALAGAPSLEVMGWHRACGAPSGAFTLHALRFDRFNALERLDASFQQRCAFGGLAGRADITSTPCADVVPVEIPQDPDVVPGPPRYELQCTGPAAKPAPAKPKAKAKPKKAKRKAAKGKRKRRA